VDVERAQVGGEVRRVAIKRGAWFPGSHRGRRARRTQPRIPEYGCRHSLVWSVTQQEVGVVAGWV